MSQFKMFGWSYVIDYCVALFRKEQEEKLIRTYFAECLRLSCENLAKMSGGQYVSHKLQDILEPKPIDTRTSGEIIGGIRERINKLNQGGDKE